MDEEYTEHEDTENPFQYEYSNTCAECGRRFTGGYMHVTLCPRCLETFGLHIIEEDYYA